MILLDYSQANHRQVACGQILVLGRDAPSLLEPAHDALNDVSLPIDLPIESRRMAPLSAAALIVAAGHPLRPSARTRAPWI
jgi:hypothetical protein